MCLPTHLLLLVYPCFLESFLPAIHCPSGSESLSRRRPDPRSTPERCLWPRLPFPHCEEAHQREFPPASANALESSVRRSWLVSWRNASSHLVLCDQRQQPPKSDQSYRVAAPFPPRTRHRNRPLVLVRFHIELPHHIYVASSCLRKLPQPPRFPHPPPFKTIASSGSICHSKHRPNLNDRPRLPQSTPSVARRALNPALHRGQGSIARLGLEPSSGPPG